MGPAELKIIALVIVVGLAIIALARHEWSRIPLPPASLASFSRSLQIMDKAEESARTKGRWNSDTIKLFQEAERELLTCLQTTQGVEKLPAASNQQSMSPILVLERLCYVEEFLASAYERLEPSDGHASKLTANQERKRVAELRAMVRRLEKHYAEHIQLVVKYLGTNSTNVIAPTRGLADLLAKRGDVVDAMALLQRCVQIAVRPRPPDKRMPVDLRIHIEQEGKKDVQRTGRSLHEARGETQLQVAQRKQALADPLDPDQHHMAASLAAQLAAICRNQPNRAADSVRWANRALEAAARVLGSGHPQMAILYQSLALSLLRCGKLQEAQDAAQIGLEIAQSTLGTDHLQSLALMQTVAVIQSEDGHTDEAEALLRQTLTAAKRIRKQERSHPDAWDAGQTRWFKRKWEKAAPEPCRLPVAAPADSKARQAAVNRRLEHGNPHKDHVEEWTEPFLPMGDGEFSFGNFSEEVVEAAIEHIELALKDVQQRAAEVAANVEDIGDDRPSLESVDENTDIRPAVDFEDIIDDPPSEAFDVQDTDAQLAADTETTR